MDSGNSGYSIWGVVAAFAAGAAAGTVAALLLAPASGAETRSKLKVLPRAVKDAYAHAVQAGQEAFSQTYVAQTGGDAVAKH